MNDYTGKICPYCKTEFTFADNVVVCSECDMPHHRECWVENQGCTTFGCLGTIKAADASAPSTVMATQMRYDDVAPATTNGTVFCTRCGTRNTSSYSFCSNCGNRLTTNANPTPPAYTPAPPAYTPPPQNAYTYNNQQNNYNGYNTYHGYQTPGVDTEVQMLVGTKSEYYLPKFQAMKVSNNSKSWNWPAFLVTPYWMMYRKMYGPAAIVLGADLLITLLNIPFLSLLLFVAYIVLGILGNSIYMKHIEKKATEAKTMQEPYKSQFIATNGGVNTTACILSIIARVVLVAILTM